MSPVGIVSIALGLLVVFLRGGPLMVAPAAYLRWVRRLIQANNTIRMLGAALLILGGVMAWAGTTDHSALASLLTVAGVASVAVGTILVTVPGVFSRYAVAFFPAIGEGRLSGWRVFGMVVTSAGLLLIYVGVRAL